MSKPKLLLADDSITIQKVVNLTFADQGMEVAAFGDGDSAIAQLDEVKPAIVLADVHMPGLNGYQLCERIRGNEATKHIPVVLLVGSFEPFDREEAERVGANAHLTKPFTSIADLVSTVERLLSEMAPVKEPEPRVEPGPDTSDIDHLYKQSFVETMEFPEKGSVEYEMDGYDDEMIQTSYAEPDPGSMAEESLYTADGEHDVTAPTVEVEDVETESLIADSLPAAEEAVREGVEEIKAEEVQEGEVREEEVREEEVKEAEVAYRTSDPFESVAAEPPSVQPAETPPAGAVKFGFEEDDLLELPDTGAPRQVEYTVPNSPTANGREVVSLSPELIDLIVQKVIDRLAEKNQNDEARWVSG